MSAVSPHDRSRTGYVPVRDLLRRLPAVLAGVLLLAALYLVALVYAAGETLAALACLAAVSASAWIFLSRRAYALRYVFPGIACITLFILVPVVYTVGIGFTNTSGRNLLTQERVQAYLLDQTYEAEGGRWRFVLESARPGGDVRIVLSSPDGVRFASAPLDPRAAAQDGGTVALRPDRGEPGEALAIRDVIALRAALGAITAVLPDGTRLVMTGLREFAARRPLYSPRPDGSLTDNRTGEVLRPDMRTGFYTTGAGVAVPPGFRVFVGLDNFRRIVTHPGIWGPFLAVFAWTVAFAALSALFTFILGLLLACLLQWERLAFKGLYRTLLILPYAVPSFISIQVFRGLFNQEFGEINLILGGLFGIRPEWLTDPMLARGMLLLVNTWLGYPYMMILALGLLQLIPRDLYEASALDGAGPVSNFLRITLPSVIRPFIPLLVACFAFNFNNFVLIALLTGGRPDFLGTVTPAGTTDLLVTYTYRIAFQNSAQDFGLAAAISTIIFAMVAVIALVNLRLAGRRT